MFRSVLFQEWAAQEVVSKVEDIAFVIKCSHRFNTNVGAESVGFGRVSGHIC